MKKSIVLVIIGFLLAACTQTADIKDVAQPSPVVLAFASPTPAATVQPIVSTTTASTQKLQANLPAPVPDFDHIILILLENEYLPDTIGNPQLPNLNTLAQRYVLLTNYFAVSHPSLPNYLALVSGSTQDVNSDCMDCFVDQPNLADEIEASGRTWKSYQESMPSPCFLGNKGQYAQMLDPFLYFDSVRLDKTRCDQSIVPLDRLDADLAANTLPDFALIMPDKCDSGHDCAEEKADSWVSGVVSKLQAAPALGQKYLIAITFDEGTLQSGEDVSTSNSHFRGQVAAILISPQAKTGFVDSSSYTHYSLLKTILQAWKLPALGQTAKDTVPSILAPWITQPGG